MKRDVTVPPRPPATGGLRWRRLPALPAVALPVVRLVSGAQASGSFSQELPAPKLERNLLLTYVPVLGTDSVNPLMVPRGSELPKGRVTWAAAGPPVSVSASVCKCVLLRRGCASETGVRRHKPLTESAWGAAAPFSLGWI